ncbi:hypothetical protein EDB81DRAFT_759375 [Dactylonectria macrodidyma]|uniref:Myb-like domain-containing protein n=1 Tax=Dactylonectria macrodidyma TaxID=307937 RepID=A0A9P9EWT5_9HYPO|nr:hypothetical protein EDB81DRAFT_759375 [Dactylonectria macrodidyma]
MTLDLAYESSCRAWDRGLIRLFEISRRAGDMFHNLDIPITPHLQSSLQRRYNCRAADLASTKFISAKNDKICLRLFWADRLRFASPVDESIHLANACQLAGFRHVVGTLWSVDDKLCVDMARMTYEFMRDEGISDDCVSRGLHRATRTARDHALHAALARGHKKIAQLLIDKNADVNARGGRYGNALQAASVGGHEKIVQLPVLLDNNADVNARGGRYRNALQAALARGHEKIPQLLWALRKCITGGSGARSREDPPATHRQAGSNEAGLLQAMGLVRFRLEHISRAMPVHVPLRRTTRVSPLSLDFQLLGNSNMASTTSDTGQPKLLQIFSPLSAQAVNASLRYEEALSTSGESTDTAICISDDDDTDTEDEEDDSQSCCTTPTKTSIADRLDSTGTKHSPTESEVAIGTDTTSGASPVQVEGVSIWTHESHMDRFADPDQQPPLQTNHTPAGDTTACTNASFDVSTTSPGSHPCLSVLDEQHLVTEATGATSEPGIMMIDAPSEAGSCHGVQSTPISPSVCTDSPNAAAPEEMAHRLLHDSEVCAGTSRDDAIPGDNTSSRAVWMSPEPQEQDIDHISRGFSDAESESESSEAESGSPFASRVSPPQELRSRRRSRRRSSHAHQTVQDKDSGVDTEGSGSEDDLDVRERVRDEDYCPSPPGVQGYDSGGDSEDSPEECRTSVCDTEGPSRSQAAPVSSEVPTLLARFEEWPLQDVSLKRITEGGKTTFQLKFEWAPGPSRAQTDRSVSHSEGREPPKATLSGTRSSGQKWTTEEENTVRTMRRAGCSWTEIHRALPHRSQDIRLA